MIIIKTGDKIETRRLVPGGIVTGYNFAAAAACPECAMRRMKKAAAQKRWREGKKQQDA